jgi:signal transduction histidine kinase/DNA-binding response OmpR family regulator
MEPIRILYVEDDPTDRELTRRALRQHAPEIEIRLVGSGREAREVISTQPFDLILLDYRLPDVEELELLKELLVASPGVPVVMVTASGDPDLAVSALKLGASDYVVKKPGYLERLPGMMRETFSRFQHEQRRRTRRLRILYAEHEPDDITFTLRHFSAHAPQLTVETATTGPGVLRALESARYDLLLLDYRMPGMNGLEILQEMRDHGVRVPVVMVTGHKDEEVAVAALKYGAMDYVVKREGYIATLPPIIDRAIAQWALSEEKEALLVVRDIARTIASTLDLKEVLPRVASAAATLLKTDRSLVLLLSEDGSELLPAAWHGESDEVAGRLRFRVGQDVPGRAAALRRVVSAPDVRVAEDVIHREVAEREGIGGVLSAPMVARDRLLGVLSVAGRGPRAFRRLDETLLSDLAAFAATWIENARLHEGLQQAAHQLEAKVEERTRDLEAALGRVETMSRHKSQFLANMSHELRTPLNSILGFTELLQDPQFGTLTSKQSRYLGHIHSSGKHLLSLINDLLDLSKVEAGRLELRPEPFPLADALTAALDQFGTQVDAKGVALSLQMGEAPDMLVADPLRFKQILFNLLSNAIKFTPTGGAITVTARRWSPPTNGDFVEIAVTDTGIGIKAEDLGRLFEEFTQLEGSLDKPHQGTGLGLALTKRLVELHGGAITVASPGEGQGSTFTVTLPLQPPRTQGRVLLVEEDTQLGAQIAVTLQKAGFGVDLVGDGEAALAQAEHIPPDMVILDLALTGLPGVEVLRRFHAEGFPHLPILVLVRRAGDPVQEALTLGAEEFLVKPVSLGLLTDAVKRLLGRVETEGGAAPARANTNTVH